MADDVRLNLGAGGELIAADEVGGAKHQRVKVGHGADGVYGDVDDTNPLPVAIRAALDGEAVRVTNGGLDVNTQDQHTKPFDLFFSQITATGITLSIDAVIDTYSASFTTGHGIVVGEQIVIYDTVSTRLYVGEALTSAVNIVEFDTPLNFSFPKASTIAARSAKELNVDGSVTRQTFQVSPPVDLEIDITRIMLQMITNNAADLDAFGDIALGLDRGLAVRVVNGENINLFNAKTNGELKNLMFDLEPIETSKFGVFGVAGRMTFAGQNKHGVTIRLAQDETLEAIIQDDLRSLVSFRMIAAGHIVE